MRERRVKGGQRPGPRTLRTACGTSTLGYLNRRKHDRCWALSVRSKTIGEVFDIHGNI